MRDVPVCDPRLAEVLRRLIEAYAPERIYLFGSSARGEAGPDSDYDLLLVAGSSIASRAESFADATGPRCLAGQR